MVIKRPKTRSDNLVNLLLSCGQGYRRNNLHKFMESRGYGRCGPNGEEQILSKKGEQLFDYKVIPDAWRWHRWKKSNRENGFELEMVECIETSPINTRKASAYFNADDRRVDGLFITLTAIDKVGKILCYRQPCSDLFWGLLAVGPDDEEIKDLIKCDDFTSRCIHRSPRLPRLPHPSFPFEVLTRGTLLGTMFEDDYDDGP